MTSWALPRPRRSVPRSVSRGARAAALAAALGVLGVLGPTVAAAAPKRDPAAAQNAAERARARKLAQEGYERFQAGDHASAEKLFLEAEALFHAPTHWLYVARARAKQGQLIEAEEAYAQVLADALPARAPKPFLDAQASAKEEIEEVRRRIPRLTVRVTGAPQGVTPEATIDGAAITPGEAVRVKPGARLVRVTAAGASPAEQVVVVAEGESRDVAIALAPPVAVAKREGSVVPAAVTLGLGAVGLGVGAVTGVLSLNKVSDLEATCTDKHCSPEQRPVADDARALGTVSTIGFIAGGVLVGAGIALFVLRPFGGGSGPAEGEAAAGPRVTAVVGPGSLIVRGTF